MSINMPQSLEETLAAFAYADCPPAIAEMMRPFHDLAIDIVATIDPCPTRDAVLAHLASAMRLARYAQFGPAESDE